VSPALVSTHAWQAVSMGSSHTCGLYTDGTRFCWGSNFSGQLGLGDTTTRLRPIRILSEGAWSAISTSSNQSCGIRTSGALYCWGQNNHGQVGNGTTTDRLRPTLVA